MRTLNVSEQGMELFKKVHEKRPQDRTLAETFDHILKKYMEQNP